MRDPNKKLITRWDSERELFTTTSCTYYKIQNLLSNEAAQLTKHKRFQRSFELCDGDNNIRLLKNWQTAIKHRNANTYIVQT